MITGAYYQRETPWQLFFFQFKKKRKYNNDISGENKKQKQLFKKKLHMFTKSQMCQTRCHMRSTLNSSFGMEILIKCLWREHWISPGYDIVAVYFKICSKIHQIWIFQFTTFTEMITKILYDLKRNIRLCLLCCFSPYRIRLKATATRQHS